MSASHPTFERGHCFQREPLSKREVELLGEILHERLKTMRSLVPVRIEPSEYEHERRRVNGILSKLDHPLYEGSLDGPAPESDRADHGPGPAA